MRSKRIEWTDAPAMLASRSARVESGCIEWTAGGTAGGYGTASVAGQRWYAHRLAYTLANGAIPAGLHICHRCDNPPCINPDHLFAGTALDNMRDSAAKGRNYRGGSGRGEAHGMAKLTEDSVRAIRARWAAGASVQNIADEFGTSQGNVRFIVQRKTWRHVA